VEIRGYKSPQKLEKIWKILNMLLEIQETRI
jgi:hypothetical protein